MKPKGSFLPLAWLLALTGLVAIPAADWLRQTPEPPWVAIDARPSRAIWWDGDRLVDPRRCVAAVGPLFDQWKAIDDPRLTALYRAGGMGSGQWSAEARAFGPDGQIWTALTSKEPETGPRELRVLAALDSKLYEAKLPTPWSECVVAIAPGQVACSHGYTTNDAARAECEDATTIWELTPRSGTDVLDATARPPFHGLRPAYARQGELLFVIAPLVAGTDWGAAVAIDRAGRQTTWLAGGAVYTQPNDAGTVTAIAVLRQTLRYCLLTEPHGRLRPVVDKAVEWSPSGRYLSMVRDDQLYVLDVESWLADQ